MRLAMIPRIKKALFGWQSVITLVKIEQSAVNYKNIETETVMTFKGVVQPADKEKLKISAIGERSWRALMIHTQEALFLNTGDKVEYSGVRYKILEKNDFSLNGFYEYILIEDYGD